jgi:MFS family permease
VGHDRLILAFASVIPVTGWATERFGAKRVWLASLLLFLLGSVLSGAAWSIGSLLGFRVLQGFGAGMILPVGQTMLAQAANVIQRIAANLPNLHGGIQGIESLSPQQQADATPALADAFGSTFWVAVGLIAASIVPALLLPNPSREQAEAAMPAAEHRQAA